MKFIKKSIIFFQENKTFCIIFLCFFILTAFVRFVDIFKFLPDYSIDENDVVEFGVGFMGGNYEPFWYKYGSLYAYILSFIYRFLSFFDSRPTEIFAQDIFFNPTIFYYTARFINSVLNILLAIMAFKIAKKTIGEKLDRYVLLIAILPVLDFFTGFTIRVDTLLAVCVAFTIWFMIRVIETGKTKYYLLTGLFVGLGLATKPLPSFLILPSLFLTHCWLQYDCIQSKKSKNQKKVKSNFSPVHFLKAGLNYNFLKLILIAIFSNLLYNPYLFKRFSSFKKEQLEAVVSEGSRNFTSGLDITRFFDTMGYVLTIIGVIAVIYLLYCSIRQKNIKYFLIASYPIFFWLAFSMGASRNYFYIPIVIFIMIATVQFIADMSLYFSEKYRQVVFYIGICLVTAQPLYQTIYQIIKYNRSYQHSEIFAPLAAKVWTNENLDQNAKIIMLGEYTALPRIVSSQKSLYGNFDEKDKRSAFLGQFFAYGRWNIEYFRNLFIKAHDAYIKDPSKKSFSNIEYLRAGTENMKGNLFSYCINNRFDYMITNHCLDSLPLFSNRIMKEFSRKEYPFGSEVYIYDLRQMNQDDIIPDARTAVSCFLNSLIYNLIGDAQKMEEALNQCIRIDSKYPNARFNRAILYFNQQNFERAAVDFIETTKQEPKNASAYYNAGLCYYYLNDIVSAKKALQQAVKLGYKEAEKLLYSLNKSKL